MTETIIIKSKIADFNKKINISGDKSLSIRWVLLASQAVGKSKGYNLLMSEDVIAALQAIKKLGIKVFVRNEYCEINGKGINNFKYKSGLIIDSKNSGTLGRLLLGLLISFIMSGCIAVGVSSAGLFGKGVSIALDPRTLGTQVDLSLIHI